MFIFRTIVGKLWLTIIGLVAVVLLALGFFLTQYIQKDFLKYQHQTENLVTLGSKVAVEVSQRLDDPKYHDLVNELLSAQNARLIILGADYSEMFNGSGRGQPVLHATDLFTVNQLREVFKGATADNGNASEQQKQTKDFLAVAVPMKNAKGEVTAAAIIYQSLSSLKMTQHYIIRLFAYTSAIGFLLTTFFAFFLLTKITQPLQRLRKAADLITVGEFGTRVKMTTNDELGELGNTFNHMAEQLEENIKDLSHEKENLASILRSMTDAVITFDAGGCVVLINPQGEKVIRDWGEIEWIPGQEGKSGSPGQTVPEPLLHLFHTLVTESREELTYKLHVQNEVWSIVMAPLYSKTQLRGAVAVLRDVTEEHRLDKLRKDFVANVSHELRTPISMVQGYSEALLDDIVELPEQRRELAQVIHDESLRMGRLVQDLLDLARMESGHMTMNMREVDIDALMKRIHRKFTVLSREQKITLSCEVTPPDLKLEQADEDRLEQVLTNLLDNAFRHTSPGATITMKAAPALYKRKKAVLLEVTDQGRGIPQEDLPYIFERFYKADKARTRGSSGGTGLGLAIVKNIIEAHQGSLDVKSAMGQGTTFSILLPSRLNEA